MVLDFRTDDGEDRSIDVEFVRVGDQKVGGALYGEPFSRDYGGVPYGGWPDGMEMKEWNELMFALRRATEVEWAIDEALTELVATRRARFEAASADTARDPKSG